MENTAIAKKISDYIYNNEKEYVEVPKQLIEKFAGGAVGGDACLEIRRNITFYTKENKIIIPIRKNDSIKSVSCYKVVSKDFDFSTLGNRTFSGLEHELVEKIVTKINEDFGDVCAEFIMQMLMVADMLYRRGRKNSYISLNRNSLLKKIADSIMTRPEDVMNYHIKNLEKWGFINIKKEMRRAVNGHDYEDTMFLLVELDGWSPSQRQRKHMKKAAKKVVQKIKHEEHQDTDMRNALDEFLKQFDELKKENAELKKVIEENTVSEEDKEKIKAYNTLAGMYREKTRDYDELEKKYKKVSKENKARKEAVTGSSNRIETGIAHLNKNLLREVKQYVDASSYKKLEFKFPIVINDFKMTLEGIFHE